jgi:hypothetical protein
MVDGDDYSLHVGIRVSKVMTELIVCSDDARHYTLVITQNVDLLDPNTSHMLSSIT